MRRIIVFLHKLNRMLTYNANRSMWAINVEGVHQIGKNSYMDKPYIIRGAQHIIIGDNFHCCRGCRIQAIAEYEGERFSPKIVIGNNVSINMDAEISSINEVIIEDGVQLASNVLIVDHLHGKTDGSDAHMPPAKRKLFSKGRVHICKNVWIGFGCAILPGVTIGEGSIIGANSVISKDVESYSVIAGVPGTMIRRIDYR